MSMYDRRLDFVLADSSVVQLKKHIAEMFEHHGYNCQYVTVNPGYFYDTLSWEVDYTKDNRAYVCVATVKISETDQAPRRLEALLMNQIANDKHYERIIDEQRNSGNPGTPP